MAVTVTSAQRSESLLEALVTWLCDVPDDPFEPDLVIVPTLGVKDWLRSELAAHLGTTGKRDGVVANVRFQLSGWLNHEAIGLAGDLDPRWNLNHLPWSVLAVLHRSPGKMPGFKGSDQPLSQARHVADLFDRYATHRPAMLRSWLTPDGSGDHDGTVEAVVLDDDHLWQPALFRALRAEIDAPSPAELLAELPTRLSGQASSGELPRRLAIFGLGTITPAQANVLAALALHCDIRILAHLPSRSSSGRHPLTQAWGGSASPTSDLLSDMAVVERIDLTPGATDSTLLERLQAAVDEDADRPPPVASASTLGATGGDGSIQIHACHGTTRQVEALRDALLHLIRADPTLTARDVIVVCPDLRRFAPLIEPTLAAVFDRPGVTAALADRSLARLSPVAAAIDALFRFAIGRASVEDFFLLLNDPVISSAMGLDDHMDSLHRWFEVLHIRWGLDAGHRQRWGYPQGLKQGTWSEAVDQLLAGVLAQAPDPVEFQGGIVPHDDVDEKELEAVGLLAQAIERVRLFADQCAVPHPLDGWCDVIEEQVDNLLKVDENDDRHRRDLMRLLTELRADADTVDGVPLGVRDVVNLLASRLRAEATNIRLRTGNVTVASPKPLRGVPARVVAVVGFDDEAIQAPADDGDDLLVLRPQIGERSRLLDHRRGFLDLVLGARDHLLVTCDGWDVTTGLKVPLAGHLARLLEAAQAEAEATGGGTRPLLVEHTRHLADRANLDPKADGPAQLLEGRPWTHDPNAPRIVKAMDPGQATVAASGSSWAVGSESPEAVDLDDVARGVRNPGEALLHRRLGVSLPKKAEQSTQEIDLWPDGLTFWKLGQDLLDRRLLGRSTGAWKTHHRLLGDLPPEALGEAALNDVAAEVKELLAKALEKANVPLPVPESRAVEVNVEGTVVRGDIPVSTELLLHLRFTRWHPSYHLRPWLRLALATLADPDIDWEAVLAFRGRGAGDDPVVHHRRMRGTGEERLVGARRSLRTVIDLDRRARSDVIPLFNRYSWSLMFKEPEGKQRAALERDLTEDQWTDWLHPDTTLEDLKADTNQNHPADVNLPTATFRAERYAKFLYDAWNETTEEVPPPPVGGTGNGKTGGGGHS